ncbi:MAG: galactokinase family protein [Solirubrobacteraceae bacterium]
MAQRVAAFAPGRVNLIGEHTDYNGGLCLPFAIARGVTVGAERHGGQDIEATTSRDGAHDRFPPAAPPREGAQGWRAHVRGTVSELGRAGVPVPPARVRIESDLPPGAGLASSAALKVALALALCSMADRPAPAPLALAELCQAVEHRWAGAPTGLLDPLASLLGEPGRLLRLDCGARRWSTVPWRLSGWTLALADSGERRELAASGYAARREECARAARALGRDSLRGATLDEAESLPEPLRSRVRHVVSEDVRVDDMVLTVRAGDGRRAGALLDAGQLSLREDFEASTPAVEATVARMLDAGATGARMTGGGFGGSVIALLPPGASLPAGAVVVAPSAGARVVDAA